MIIALVWILVQVGYDGRVKVTTFEGPAAERSCEAARTFLTLSTKDSYCVDP